MGWVGVALGPGAAWLGRGDRKPSHSHAFRPSLGINSSKLDCKRGIILLLIADADACMHVCTLLTMTPLTSPFLLFPGENN